MFVVCLFSALLAGGITILFAVNADRRTWSSVVGFWVMIALTGLMLAQLLQSVIEAVKG